MRRIIALLLAFLLTGTLVLFSAGFVCHQIIAPAMNEGGAKVSDTVIRGEQALAKDRIAELADIYGFDAEPVAALVDEETLRGLNAQASLWWSTVLRKGETGGEIEWDTKALEEVLAADPALARQAEQEDDEYIAETGAEKVRESMVRMVLPMRRQVIRIGLEKAGKKADMPNLITFFLGIPWAALALCALLAGLIVLLESRKKRFSRLYIGSALGGAAIVLVCLAVLAQTAGIQQLIHEASLSLEIQTRDIVVKSMIRTGILAAMMAAGCGLCLGKSRKGRKTA